jgi:hypothetical protein
MSTPTPIITASYVAECIWCQEPTGDAGTPIPAPFPTVHEAIADAIEQGFSHDETSGRVLCPQCAQHAESLPAEVLASLQTQPEPTAPGWWVHLDYFGPGAATTGDAYFARRDCGFCLGAGLTAAAALPVGEGGDALICTCVRHLPQTGAMVPALLLDAHGHVVDELVLAPADVETWVLDRPLLVATPGYDPDIATLAGRVALREGPIGRDPAVTLAQGESWMARCAYCDAELLEDTVYRTANGDLDDQVCRSHPRTDRPRPHLPKWRIWHEASAALYVTDFAHADEVSMLRERAHAAAPGSSPATSPTPTMVDAGTCYLLHRSGTTVHAVRVAAPPPEWCGENTTGD